MKHSIKLFLCVPIISVMLLLTSCGQQAPSNSHPPIVQYTPTPTISVNITPLPHTDSAPPAHLAIPSLNINASVESVGVASTGDMQTPQQAPWDDVGWYNSGPRPGQLGSAVIDGHLDRPGGAPAVFWRLRYVQVGALVQVTNEQGKTLTFRVTQVELYPPKQAPIQQIFGDSSGNYLNLITCAGDWIPSEHQTTLRLVVYTVLVG